MTTFEPWAVENTPPIIESHSEPAVALNAGIKSLAAAKDTLEIIPIRVVVESVIRILVLVRVRVPDLPSLSHTDLSVKRRTR